MTDGGRKRTSISLRFAKTLNVCPRRSALPSCLEPLSRRYAVSSLYFSALTLARLESG